MDDRQAESPHAKGRGLRTLLNVVLSLIVLGAGIAVASYLANNKPQARKRPSVDMAPWVQVMTVAAGSQTVSVSAMGTVVPAWELTVKPRVAGQIEAVHPEFKPGGLIAAGERIVQIDPEDYRLRLAQKQLAVAEARYELKLELGHQDVAAREWALLGGPRPEDAKDSELALRQPHLEKAQAALAAAEAELAQAQRDLAYTAVRAPFNVVVRSKDTAVGAQVSTGDRLAVLVGTDRFWIQVSLPTDRLEWITIPTRSSGAGSLAAVIYQDRHRLDGQVVRLLGELTPEGRMAQLMVAVEDPLGLKAVAGRPPLLIGEFVKVEIQGRRLDEVYRIPRAGLRDGRQIWLADEKDRLEVREVTPVWRDRQTVLLDRGLLPGERLVVSELAAPVSGMSLRIETPAAAAPGSQDPVAGGRTP